MKICKYSNMTEKEYEKLLRNAYLRSKGYDPEKVGKEGEEFIRSLIEKNKSKVDE